MNILFVCSRNKKRSLTAETIFRYNNAFAVLSAGTEEVARRRITHKMIDWADLIFVMEKKHRQRLQDAFDAILHNKQVIVMDIPDEYEYMDEELIEMLKDIVSSILDI